MMAVAERNHTAEFVQGGEIVNLGFNAVEVVAKDVVLNMLNRRLCGGDPARSIGRRWAAILSSMKDQRRRLGCRHGRSTGRRVVQPARIGGAGLDAMLWRLWQIKRSADNTPPYYNRRHVPFDHSAVDRRFQSDVFDGLEVQQACQSGREFPR